MVDLMPEGFEPRRAGNRPRVDISEMLVDLHIQKKQHPGRWLAYPMAFADARSAKRQLTEKGYEVSVERDRDNDALAKVYVRAAQ